MLEWILQRQKREEMEKQVCLQELRPKQWCVEVSVVGIQFQEGRGVKVSGTVPCELNATSSCLLTIDTHLHSLNVLDQRWQVRHEVKRPRWPVGFLFEIFVCELAVLGKLNDGSLSSTRNHHIFFNQLIEANISANVTSQHVAITLYNNVCSSGKTQKLMNR